MRRRRILKTRPFNRWAMRVSVGDTALLTAVEEIAQGLIDGDLGGNERANIRPRELEALRELAHDLLELNERQIDVQTKSGALEEIVD